MKQLPCSAVRVCENASYAPTNQLYVCRLSQALRLLSTTKGPRLIKTPFDIIIVDPVCLFSRVLFRYFTGSVALSILELCIIFASRV